MSGRHLAFPFHIGTDGRSATPHSHRCPCAWRDHPTAAHQSRASGLSCRRSAAGLRRLVFEAADDVSAGLAKATISQAISFWLQGTD